MLKLLVRRLSLASPDLFILIPFELVVVSFHFTPYQTSIRMSAGFRFGAGADAAFNFDPVGLKTERLERQLAQALDQVRRAKEAERVARSALADLNRD